MKLMINTLRSNNLENNARYLDELLANRSRKSWEDDVLSNNIDNIISQAKSKVTKNPTATFREDISINEFEDDPPGDIYSLLNEGWSVITSHYASCPNAYKVISRQIFNALKRDTMPLYASA